MCQSYIFFGNAVNLVNQVNEMLFSKDQHIEFLIIDFKNVFGVDSSTLFSFIKISRKCRETNTKLIFSDLPIRVKKKFEGTNATEHLLEFTESIDLQHSFQIFEEIVLEKHKGEISVSEIHRLESLLPNVGECEGFIDSLELVEVDKGEVFIEQGATSDFLYILQKGIVEVYIKNSESKDVTIKILILAPSSERLPF